MHTTLPSTLHNLILATAADSRGYATLPGLSFQLRLSTDEVLAHIAKNSDLFTVEHGHALRRIRLSGLGAEVAKSIKFVLTIAEDARGFVTIPGISIQLNLSFEVARKHIAENPALFTVERGSPLTRCRLSAVGRKMLESIKNRFCRPAGMGDGTETKPEE